MCTVERAYFETGIKGDETFILYELNDDICHMLKYNLDEENIPMFFVLLKDAATKFINKKVKLFEQYVLESEWYDYLSNDPLWTLVNIVDNDDNAEDNNIAVIRCNIEDMPVCIARGLGINEST
jgi:hypothetical protein